MQLRNISKKEVRSTVNNPDDLYGKPRGEMVAVKKIGDRTLKIAYVKYSDHYKIITPMIEE